MNAENKRRCALGEYHPAASLLYFASVIGTTMFFMQPVMLCASLLGAVSCYVRLKGGGARYLLGFVLPVTLLAAAANAAFNHRGATILCYLPTGNPLTLESIAYGASAAVMFAAVLTWFGCFSEVMTSDKLVFLFGRVIPSLSLMISMTLRFVPRFVRRFSEVREARACLGKTPRSPFGKLHEAFACFAAVTAWAFEGSVVTADSMKSRGYGMGRRTSYALYRLSDRDRRLMVWTGLCLLFIIIGTVCGGIEWQFFPILKGSHAAPLAVAIEAAYLALCLTAVRS